MKMEQSVPKRRHIKSRRRVTTQKKAYTINPLIQKTARVRASGLTIKSKFCSSCLNFVTPTTLTTTVRSHATPTTRANGRSPGVSNKITFFLLFSRDFLLCLPLILSVQGTLSLHSQNSEHSSPYEEHGKTWICLLTNERSHGSLTF